MKKLLMIAVLMTLAAEAHAETSVLRSLPTATQKQIENIRAECRGADLTTTSGDEGLSPFALSETHGERHFLLTRPNQSS